MPLKKGEGIFRWWFDPAKVTLLEEAMADDITTSSTAVEEIPTKSTTWIAALAIIAVGVLLFGIRRRSHRSAA